jgi:hypothetical protein
VVGCLNSVVKVFLFCVDICDVTIMHSVRLRRTIRDQQAES